MAKEKSRFRFDNIASTEYHIPHTNLALILSKYSMTSFDFEAALRQSLPPELRAIAAPLTVFLEDIFTGKLGNEEANGVILEIPEFRDAVRALEGHEIRSKDAVISFGSGSNLGDITINGNVAGRDIVNLSVSLNIMETPPFNLAGVVTSFLILVAVVILVFISSDIRNSIARVFPAPQATEAISTRVSSETLIIIASFYYTEGNKNTEVHNEIVQALRRELLRLNLTNIRIETTKETIRAGEDEVAEAIGAQYDADIIIWGEDTGARVAVNFLNRRATQMGMDSLITINETDRTQIADPPAYSQFITNDLPKQVTFLSLYAIAQTSDRNSAIKLLEQSVVSLPNETALYGLANAYYTLGDWYYGPGQNLQLAIDYYSRSIQAGNNSTTVYHNRGIARWKVGDRVGAVEDFGLFGNERGSH